VDLDDEGFGLQPVAVDLPGAPRAAHGDLEPGSAVRQHVFRHKRLQQAALEPVRRPVAGTGIDVVEQRRKQPWIDMDEAYRPGRSKREAFMSSTNAPSG
jgi:hypothetical protein